MVGIGQQDDGSRPSPPDGPSEAEWRSSLPETRVPNSSSCCPSRPGPAASPCGAGCAQTRVVPLTRVGVQAMRCPFCKADNDKVVDSRAARRGPSSGGAASASSAGAATRRTSGSRRSRCGSSRRTELAKPFDRQKIYRGIGKACEKRPVPTERLERVVEEIERDLADVADARSRRGRSARWSCTSFATWTCGLRALCFRLPGLQGHQPIPRRTASVPGRERARAMPRITKVLKRDGREVLFDESKIANAIFKAAQAVGGEDRQMSDELASVVTMFLEREFEDRSPGIEDIQDIVEKVLDRDGARQDGEGLHLYRTGGPGGASRSRSARRSASGGSTDIALLVDPGTRDELLTWDRQRIVDALVHEARSTRPSPTTSPTPSSAGFSTPASTGSRLADPRTGRQRAVERGLSAKLERQKTSASRSSTSISSSTRNPRKTRISRRTTPRPSTCPSPRRPQAVRPPGGLLARGRRRPPPAGCISTTSAIRPASTAPPLARVHQEIRPVAHQLDTSSAPEARPHS